MEKTGQYKFLNVDFTNYRTRLSRKFENRRPFTRAVPGNITSFIPGTVTNVFVKEGEKIKEGDVVLILDAMKMQNRLRSHVSGRVSKVYVKKGDRVVKGAVLVEIEQSA